MSKICKKGYLEMTKKNYLETLKSVLGLSILHYLNFSCILNFLVKTLVGVLLIERQISSFAEIFIGIDN